MKTRAEAAALANKQLDGPTAEMSRLKENRAHYGKQELRELLDFIYGGEPADDNEKIGGNS